MTDHGAIEEPQKNPTVLFSNEWYDRLKWLAQIGLPALAALYFGLSQIWGLPYGEEVVGTIAVIDVFLGSVLQLSSRNFVESGAKYDGVLVAKTGQDDQLIYTYDVGETPLEDLKTKRELILKVEDHTVVPTQRSR